MKVAFVYDRLNKIGGAERVLLTLHEVFPEAPIYTLVYDSNKASWAKVFPKIYTSFIQKIPFAKNNHEYFFWLAPIAFETFDFSNYDVVISVTSAEAKGIITNSRTLHICYCLTPTRYLWSSFSKNIFLNWIFCKLRIWDQVACLRPDKYITISKNIALKIKKIYHLDSKIIYPPLNINYWKIKRGTLESYYLIVSRLVPYKRVDIAIKAFNSLGWPLKIIGTGRQLKKLKRMAKNNIEFLGQLTDRETLDYYQRCKAVLFCGEDDFGLVPLEAQACGKPVIASKAGGALETIRQGITGEFFWPQTSEALIKVLEIFEEKTYNQNNCRKNAKRFELDKFKKLFKELVDVEWKKHKKNIIM